MTRNVSATQAKNQFASLIEWVKSNNDAVVVETRGKETAAIISPDQYAEFLELKERMRREKVLDSLRRIREEGAERNSDLSEEEAMELAVTAVREVRAEMAAERREAELREGKRRGA